ncbi:MAG: dephospho-CoA kinase [Candidatus Omnitrophica bacterium]|nr:dephospho-CoA kinase [Candidatus Omnitrophota bacterium]
MKRRKTFPSVSLPGITTVAITGIFGSGKTTVSTIFKEEGIPVIDCDKLSHQVLAKPGVIPRIRRFFGPEVITKDGRVNRRKLAQTVFPNAQKRKWLENLIHPYVLQQIHQRLLDYKKKKSKIVAVEIPLLFEIEAENLFTRTVVVSTAPEIIKQRLQKSFSSEEIEQRWQCQLPQEYKIKRADFIIDNSRSRSFTRWQVKQTIKELKTEVGGRL